jgi:hypothetical protein
MMFTAEEIYGKASRPGPAENEWITFWEPGG